MYPLASRPATLFRALRGRLWWQVVRLIQRLLVGSRGEVTALEQAIHLQERLVILAMVAASVVPALLLLVYFAFTAADPVSFETEQKNQAQHLGERLLETAVKADLELGFQGRVLDRLRAGGSAIERLDPLHPELLLAWQVDENGHPMAPFGLADDGPNGDPGVLVEGPYADARARAGPSATPETSLALFSPVSARASSRLARMLATLQVAKAEEATHLEEALAVLDGLAANDEGVRDPWGFRIRDRARLEAVRIRLAVDPEQGMVAVRGLIEALLTEPWHIGQGTEAAVARAALKMLPAGSRAPPWAADASSRLATRAELLYWSGALLPEWEHTRATQPVDFGDDTRMSWALGERALWAALTYRNARYVFALDRESLRQIFSDRARGALGSDQPIVARFSTPADPASEPAEQQLARVSLDPWLPGCAFVVVPSSHYAEQLAARARQDMLRKAVVVVSLATLMLGVFFTIRLVIRELDLAQMKTRFAANVSHELRSPLTQIRLKGEALMLGLADTPEEQQAYYRAIVRESERLGRLVDDVLDYAVLPSGRHNLAPRIRMGSLVDTVHRALDSIHASEELRSMDLDVDLPTDLPPIAHDPDAVVRCVINLVSNAAKYGKESKWIGVRARQVDGGVEVSISDRGIGILPIDVDRIFDPYFRSADPRVGNKKGAGLGLTMTQEIMKAHGGKVHVHSRLGRGSTFTLRFPLHAAPGHLSPPSR